MKLSATDLLMMFITALHLKLFWIVQVKWTQKSNHYRDLQWSVIIFSLSVTLAPVAVTWHFIQLQLLQLYQKTVHHSGKYFLITCHPYNTIHRRPSKRLPFPSLHYSLPLSLPSSLSSFCLSTLPALLSSFSSSPFLIPISLPLRHAVPSERWLQGSNSNICPLHANSVIWSNLCNCSQWIYIKVNQYRIW